MGQPGLWELCRDWQQKIDKQKASEATRTDNVDDLLLDFESIDQVWDHLKKRHPAASFEVISDGNAMLYSELAENREVLKSVSAEEGNHGLPLRTRIARRLELDSIYEYIAKIETGAPSDLVHHRVCVDAKSMRSISKLEAEKVRLEPLVQVVVDKIFKHEVQVADESERKDRLERVCSQLLEERGALSLPTFDDLNSSDKYTRDLARAIINRVDCVTASRESDQAIRGLLVKNGDPNDQRIAKFVPQGSTDESVKAAETRAAGSLDDDALMQDPPSATYADSIKLIVSTDSDHLLLRRASSARYLLASYYSTSKKQTKWRLVDFVVRDSQAEWCFASVEEQVFATQLVGSETSFGTLGVGLRKWIESSKARAIHSDWEAWRRALEALDSGQTVTDAALGIETPIVSEVKLGELLHGRIKQCWPEKNLECRFNIRTLLDRLASLTAAVDPTPGMTKPQVLADLAFPKLELALRGEMRRTGGSRGDPSQPANHSYTALRFHSPATPAQGTSKQVAPPVGTGPRHLSSGLAGSRQPSTWSKTVVKTPGLYRDWAHESAESTKALEQQVGPVPQEGSPAEEIVPKVSKDRKGKRKAVSSRHKR
ncbi:uncharacterized protein JCM15063_004010 [Sporobolomyces koalae]|uniref:uncharacterized protein n=1 Tax=Sporobolomyces koalae TaxID=500713 RepID=UPI00316E528E